MEAHLWATLVTNIQSNGLLAIIKPLPWIDIGCDTKHYNYSACNIFHLECTFLPSEDIDVLVSKQPIGQSLVKIEA